MTSTPEISISLSISTSGALSDVGIRPALLSTILLLLSTVQRLPRAAKSPGPSSTSIPKASSTPRPIRYLTGSYPKSAMCPGPLPGVIPCITGVVTPAALRLASLSKLGIRAVSNSDLFVSGCGAPPRPSTTSKTIFESVGRHISARNGRSIMDPIQTQGIFRLTFRSMSSLT